MSDISLDFSGLLGVAIIAACAVITGVLFLGLALAAWRQGAGSRLAPHARAAGVAALVSTVAAGLCYQLVESLWGPDGRDLRTTLDGAALGWPVLAALAWWAMVRRRG